MSGDVVNTSPRNDGGLTIRIQWDLEPGVFMYTAQTGKQQNDR